jgi:hypothetical protein
MIRETTPALALAVAMILAVSAANAQAPDSLWHRAYGDTLSDFGNSVTETAEGHYVTTGKTQIYDAILDKVHTDLIVIKTDANGAKVWERTYGGTEHDSGRSVIQNSSGEYVVAGFTESYGAGGKDAYLLVIDQAGDTVWTRTYGRRGVDEIAYCVRQTADGGYLMAGEADDSGNEDVYLVRVDAVGDTLWTRTYGGPNYDLAMESDQTPDGGFIVAGTALTATMDVYLLRTDANGDTLWTNKYDFGLNDYGASVKALSYWGYIVTGYVQGAVAPGNNVLLMQVNHMGGMNWSRFYGGTGDDTGSCVEVVSTGGYVITGITDSFGAGGDDMYVIRTNADGGHLWSTTYGGANTEWGMEIKETSDGGYVLTGLTSSFGSGFFDIYVVKTEGDIAGIDVGPSGPDLGLAVNAIPNPSAGAVAIYLALPSACDIGIDIYDVEGRRVRRLATSAEGPGEHSITWDGTDDLGRRVHPGIYFCRIKAGGRSATRKVAMLD